MTTGVTPTIPEQITVHLGAPGDSSAKNVTVPFSDYIRNVASSEIYPTWNENAIRANILAQISFALNRVYTEYYRARGYDFDITNSTAVDQSYRYGRDIFENIAEIADDLSASYIRRTGTVEPLFAQYCNGTSVTCDGLSQWGTVPLGEAGESPLAILRRYYGNDIELVEDAPIAGDSESYPGVALRPGTSGNDVRRLQLRLNRISANYPSIPKIANSDGVFGTQTERAVREFQRTFSLTPDGIVGRATWYRILRIYAAVKRLNELNSEGIRPEEIANLRETELREGDRGTNVRELQYLLAFVANFDAAIPPVSPDGVFGAQTRAAVQSFQREEGLPQTGVVDTVTWNRLYAAFRAFYDSLPQNLLTEGIPPYPGTPQRIGSEGETVRQIQAALAEIARTNSAIPAPTVDGIFGAGTAAAVRAFQSESGLPVSGIVGATTWNAIFREREEIAVGAKASGTQYGGEVQ